MTDFYWEIKQIHISAVLVSGALFCMRGAALLAGARWPKALAVRYLSYSIDSVLLIAAIMLMVITRQYPFLQAWLTVKVALVFVYIALGILAFRESRSQRVRIVCWVVALLVYAFIFTLARAHHPLGIFHNITGV